MNGVAWWEAWYAAGGDSGPGSRGEQAQWKADTINEFIQQNDIRSVFDLGCGDGEQIALIEVPIYMGFEPSRTARDRAISRFRYDRSRAFPSNPAGLRAQLALSMDVLYHLFDDIERAAYLDTLFAAGKRFVLIYTTRDSSHDYAGHVWHRSPPAGWTEQIDSPDPTSNCSFFVYRLPL